MNYRETDEYWFVLVKMVKSLFSTELGNTTCYTPLGDLCEIRYGIYLIYPALGYR